MYTDSPYAFAVWCAITPDNKTQQLMITYYTPNYSFTANDASFHKNIYSSLVTIHITYVFSYHDLSAAG